MATQNTPVRIDVKPEQATLSKVQKAFNTLVAKIGKRRLELEQWQEVTDRFRQKAAEEMQPVAKQLADLQVAMLKALDLAADTKGLTKAEKAVLGDFICAMASGLMDLNEGEEIKAIYNKYSPVDFDEGEQEFTNGMREAMQDIFGLDLGEDAELKSPEELIDHLHEHMAKEHQAGLEAEQEKRSRRKKTAKQIAREEAAKAESEQTSLSIREVYRKLASALHPDREQDPQERLRKTALMQRVNQAYEKKNLLVLLELQLELEHIDAQAISGLSEQRLKHFNKILKEQLAELEQEIQYFEAPILAQFQLPGYIRIHSSQVLAMLDAEIAKFKQEIRKSERELLVPNDLPAFKKWIKARQREAKAFERNLSDRNGDFPFFD